MVALAAILLVSAVRIATTWRVFSQTYDEAAHIATGMEWLAEGRYDIEPQHPPLARISVALGPFLTGARAPHGLPATAQGNEILHRGDYTTMLSRARAGILPFFLLSVIVVWLWARRLGGDVAAIFAALLYANLPPVLAHAGVATTDMAVTAGLTAAFFLFHEWLTSPTTGGALLFGAAVTIAVTSKFSSLLFLTVGAMAILLCARWGGSIPRVRRMAVLQLGLAAIVCFVAGWAVYRFSFEPIRGPHRVLLDHWLQGRSFYADISPRLHRIPLPAPQIVSGVAEMMVHNRNAHPSYLFGEHKLGSWWYYFPVAVAVKTTLGFLAAVTIAAVLLARRAVRERVGRDELAPLAAAVAILAATLPVNINIGVRHVLPVYPLLAVSAGCGLALLWKRSIRWRAIVVLLIALELIVSVRSHPDYLAYFNPLAGAQPQRVLLDSNLDWGQDLLRLSRRCKELGIDRLRLSYFGTADLSRHELPPLLPIPWEKPLPGWFAVSEGNLGSPTYPVTFKWLDRFQPVERIGKSIRLYHLTPRDIAKVAPEALDRIVVPLPLGETPGGEGRLWSARLEIENRGDTPAALYDLDGHAIAVAPGARGSWDRSSETPATLYLEAAQPESVAASVHVSSSRNGVTTPGVTVPAVPVTAFRPGPLRFSFGVSCPGCRRTLRVYALSPHVLARVSAAQEGKSLENALPLDAPSEIPFRSIELGALFPEIGPEPVVVEVVATEPGQPLWGFVTVSEPSGERLVLAEK